MKTQDTKEAFLLTLKNTKRKMPKVPAHLRERALGMLQGGMRTADVARAINCNVRTVRCRRQSYRETGRTADRPRSGRPRVTTPAQDRYIQTSHLRDRYRMATTTARVTQGTETGWTEGLQACCKAGPHQKSPATTSPMGTNPQSLDQTGLVASCLQSLSSILGRGALTTHTQ